MVKGLQFSCEETSGTDARPAAGNSANRASAKAPNTSRDLFASAEIPTPTERPLRVYAFDPSAGRYVGNYMAASVRHEKLRPGPVGKRFAVIDRMCRLMGDDVVGQACENGLTGQITPRLRSARLEISEQNPASLGTVESIGLAHCVGEQVKTSAGLYRATGRAPTKGEFEPL
jgi:hypothetical protein